MNTSADLRETLEAVDRFIAVAEELSADRVNSALRREVADAAGRAHRAADMANFYQSHTDPPVAGGRTRVIDPISNWDAAISPRTDQLVEAINAAHQIRGILEAKALEAQRFEQTWAGRFAQIFGFPSRVRAQIARGGGSPALQSVGFWASIAAQAIAGLIVTVGSALIVSLLLSN